MNYAKSIATQFKLNETNIQNVIDLLDEGNTIPFIARYRKEAHGSLDDQLLREIQERLTYLRGRDKRKEEILNLIAEQEKLTPEIEIALEKAETLSELEDIYRPFKPKRKTRASVAKEKGLEPLAAIILEQKSVTEPYKIAENFICEDKGVSTVEEVIQGAKDIIAEQISDNAEIRKRIRNLTMLNGNISSKATNEESESVYTIYYDFNEPIKKVPGHRVLAMDRGEKEKFLKISIDVEPEGQMNIIRHIMVQNNNNYTNIINEACDDAYTRLIFPSIEREIRSELTANAAEQAIKVFNTNLHQLLMQPPVKNKTVIGLDPGYRTGCKLAVVDSTGKILDTAVIYPTHSKAKVEQSKAILKDMITKYNVDVISIGNGTASKETEIFTAEVIKEIPVSVSYIIVNEAGASIYSASKLAADELPDYDLTLRSAVSIARRLQDPLAELVKIDPKAIGVGQYQHDMPQKRLSEALDGVVENCVNSVGADVNTASAPLLQRVAGISASVAKNIVKYREENGEFTSRSQLKKVPKLGPKAFEQCAGFLRIPGAKNPLDNTGIHPETYKQAEQLLMLCDFDKKDIVNKNLISLETKATNIGLQKLADEINIGIPTLKDIIKEFMKPGRDPRDELPAPMLRTDVLDISDLTSGMVLTGIVRNVIDFGAFVDIGVHQDGLVHISQICNKFIKHPSEVLKVGDVVKVSILEVDINKKRISLTMKDIEE